MRMFIRIQLHKVFPALLLALSFLLFSGTVPTDSAFSSSRELILLWNTSVTEAEASLHLSSLYPELSLTEHMEDLSICHVSSDDDFTSLLEQLDNDALIRLAEPDQSTALCASLSDMTYGDAQWAFHNTGDYTYYIKDIPIQRNAAPDIDINLPEAYSLLTPEASSRTVTVAILDTGVDIYHPALREHIWVNEAEIPGNGIDDDRNGYIDDCYGWDFFNNDNTLCHYEVTSTGEYILNPDENDNHGTHCAGIIASSEGVFGVAAGIDVRILPLKIHGGKKNSGSVADAIKAIKYAQAMGADICNMSWGTTVYSEALETVMRESDMLFVVAAGNYGGNNNSTPLYPASYSLSNMISVAYVNQNGELASDSNYGLSTVDIAAPGQDILSTTVGGEYHYLSGSSMAAPVVSGVAALLYSCSDQLYPQNVKELILQTLKPLDSLIGYIRYPGIVNAAGALSCADLLSSDRIAPTLSATTEYEESAIIVRLTTEDLGGSGLRTARYASGIHDVSYFCNGTIGQSLTDSVLYLSKQGTYTFYLADYAGNESVLVYTVQDDVLPPVLSVSYSESPDGTYTVSVSASDDASGLKRLRYLEGQHDPRYFLITGTELSTEGDNSFVATAGTAYTVYASDYRGNKTVYVVNVTPVPSERLFLNVSERTLSVGESFRLVPLVLPFHTTEYVSFSVSDETLLYVASDGTLTALSPGTATVTVTTSGGLSKSCTIHITDPTIPANDTNNTTDTNEMLPQLPS